MIPGAIAVAVLFAALVAAEKNAPPPSRRPRRPFTGRSATFALVWLLVWPIWLGALFGLLRLGFHPVLTFFAVVLAPVCVPWPAVRFIAIPLGLVRVAWVLTHLADWTWGRDRQGGAAIAAVLAARRSRRPADLRRARAYVQGLDVLAGAGVVAAALLADTDGDTAGRDRLLRALDAFDPRVVPVTAQNVAREMRLLPLLLRGAWFEIAACDAGSSRFSRFARACARRITGQGGGLVDDVLLRVWWLLAPRRRRGLRLLRRALQPSAPAAQPTPAPAPTLPADALLRALALHVWTLQRASHQPPALDDVVALAAAWDSALDEASRSLATRARSLGVFDVDAVRRGVEETVLDALARLLPSLDLSNVVLSEQPTVFLRAAERVRSARLDALEIATAAIRHRVESQPGESPALAPVDELREWAAVRELYDAVVRTGSDGRTLAWEAAQWSVCEVAVRLWNERAEHRLANAMFRWLLAEARLLGDTRSIEVQEANVKCGP